MHSRRNRRVLALLTMLFCAGCADFPLDAPVSEVPAAAPTPLVYLPRPTLDETVPSAPAQAADVAAPPRTTIFPGDDAATVPRIGQAVAGQPAAGDVVLDFVDVDVKDVVRAVLGDILGLSYAVDPGVAGRVTLQVTHPIARDDVLPALEAALKVNGVAIVSAGGLYSVVPLGGAQRRVDGLSDAGAPGYGIEVAPLRFIAAPEMQKLLEPFAPAGGIMRVDVSRNMLFLAGTAQERKAMRDTIALFDVDWLSGMSYALIRPRNVDAASLATELKEIFAGEGSPVAGLLRFIPITKLNTLLVASPRRSYLDDVGTWVARLDQPVTRPGEQVYYHRLQNAKAADIAASLGGLIGRSGGSGAAAALPAPSGFESAISPTPGIGGGADLSVPDIESLGLRRAGGAQIMVDEANNALIIRAEAADYRALVAVIEEMDVEPDQVLIQVTIAEVSLTGELRYGVEWFFNSNDVSGQFSRSATVAAQFPGFNLTYLTGSVSAVISALDSVTDVNVVSSPKLLTLDNRPARLQVGDQVPIVTQSAVSTVNAGAPIVNSVQMVDTGILLTVTPRIAQSGLVVLDIAQEVSDAVKTTTSGIDSPTIQQRKLETTVAVHDGETVALGGLMRRKETSGNSGVPVAKDIPILGALFGTTTDDSAKTELLIFLTPRVIRSAADARAATEELRRGLQGISPPRAD